MKKQIEVKLLTSWVSGWDSMKYKMYDADGNTYELPQLPGRNENGSFVIEVEVEEEAAPVTEQPEVLPDFTIATSGELLDVVPGETFEQAITRLTGGDWASNTKSFEKLRFKPVDEIKWNENYQSWFIKTEPTKRKRYGSYGMYRDVCEVRKAGATLRKKHGKTFVVTM